MSVNPLLRPQPFGGGNPYLWSLKYAAEDERFLRIFDDLATVLRRSEERCERASNSGNEDYAQAVGEDEADYIEEIIGAAFLVLQAKIRRVANAAERLHSYLKRNGIEIAHLERKAALKLSGRYKRKKASLVELVWDIGNYYKHIDEWPAEVWTNSKKGKFKQARGTRKSVQRVGVEQYSTGNMRTALEFFDIDPYSSCGKLAVQVQDWASRLYDVTRKELEAKLPAAPRKKAELSCSATAARRPSSRSAPRVSRDR